MRYKQGCWAAVDLLWIHCSPAALLVLDFAAPLPHIDALFSTLACMIAFTYTSFFLG